MADRDTLAKRVAAALDHPARYVRVHPAPSNMYSACDCFAALKCLDQSIGWGGGGVDCLQECLSVSPVKLHAFAARFARLRLIG
ncbi:hypothetical protein HNQ99_001779 [Rhizorhapis suberifaciens]|uniref:Uncharacterized protein n=1 Tax=Rhizorhapis suberifaciens TaxID=13656 RepID=A0A840HV76_9SPHN|nr:hypothetical protein [Rhizorhapis suberifaciens]MBB4641470.1 hypothetical protein [Rhizorhapis suberifaciens]